jgi:hypothetical protein
MELRSDARRLPHVQRQHRRARRSRKATARRTHQPAAPRARTGHRAPLDPDVQADRWCGHQWSSWHPINDQAPGSHNGLYRIRGRSERLVYIGEGRVRARLGAHAAKLRDTSPQRAALAAAAPLEYSVVLSTDWLPHQRLELETDLIAAHTLAFAAPPAAQFIG